MKLASLLQSELIRVGAAADDYPAAKAALVDLVADEKGIDPEPVKAALAEREALGSTIVAPGVAFPHARVDAVDDFYIAIGTFPAGAPAGENDAPVRLVCLYLMPEGESNLYLRAVSAMARLLAAGDALERLVAAPSPEAVIDATDDAGVLVKDVVTAGDIMQSEPPTVRPDTSLREAADRMVKNRTTHLPVVDETGKYLGMVEADRLLKVGLPDYLLAMNNISFLSNFEPFQDLLKQEQSTTADAILDRNHPTFMVHTPMIVVAGKLVREGLVSAPVLAPDGTLAGMISTLDFVHKVVRA